LLKTRRRIARERGPKAQSNHPEKAKKIKTFEWRKLATTTTKAMTANPKQKSLQAMMTTTTSKQSQN
jgi:hypothetical protein